MPRHNNGRKPRPWSKLKCRIESLFDPAIPLAIHCNVFVKITRHSTFDEPRHWIVLGQGRAQRIIWDFPGPFLPHGGHDQPARSTRGPRLAVWESAYGRPSLPSLTLRAYLDRPRAHLMQPFDDPYELAAILRAADRRLGRERLRDWAATLDPAHPAWPVLTARFGVSKSDLSASATSANI